MMRQRFALKMVWITILLALAGTTQKTLALTIVTSIPELKLAVLSDSSEVDIVSNLFFQQGDEILIPVNRSVHIRSSTRAVLDGGGATRFFTVAGSLILDSMKLTHGSESNGGAIFVEPNGSLRATRTEFAYNHASNRFFLRRSQVSSSWGRGGAIYSLGSLVLDSASAFIGNKGQGGALWIGESELREASAILTATDVSFIGNKSPEANGGAIVNYGMSSLRRCLFDANVAETGAGAIFSHVPTGGDRMSAKLEVHGSAFTRNEAGFGSDNIVVRSGMSDGDLTCDACFAVRRAGGLTSGVCEAYACNGCAGGQWYACSSPAGEGVTRHMKTVWW